jgi:hypothetical protein
MRTGSVTVGSMVVLDHYATIGTRKKKIFVYLNISDAPKDEIVYPSRRIG